VIEFDYPRERMLEDIRAREGEPALSELSDPRSLSEFVTRDNARLLVRVHDPEEFLPWFDRAMQGRFSALPEEYLARNLLRPIRKAVGNAHKRGNRLAPDKWISVEVVATRDGVFVEVSDEGAGFDVARTFATFRAGGVYFQHKGSGFRRYNQTKAVVSFANGGRTLRACFRAPDPELALRESLDRSARIRRSR